MTTSKNTQSQQGNETEKKQSSFSSIADIIKQECGSNARILNEVRNLEQERNMYKRRNQMLTDKLIEMQHDNLELQKEVLTKFKETLQLMKDQHDFRANWNSHARR